MTSESIEASKGGQPQQDEIAQPNGKPIDPTKNVLDLVKAESKYQDGMRDALEKHHSAMLNSTNTFQNFAREASEKIGILTTSAETKRLDELADLRLTYEMRIADMLKTSVESTSTLVSNQLLQIQSTFNERVSQLEKFRYESTGKAGVADPALADALTQMSRNISALKTTSSEGDGRLLGRNELVAYLVAAAAVGGFAMKFFNP